MQVFEVFELAEPPYMEAKEVFAETAKDGVVVVRIVLTKINKITTIKNLLFLHLVSILVLPLLTPSVFNLKYRYL